MSGRTADDYIARARSKWAADTLEHERTEALARYAKYAEEFADNGAYNAVVAAERLRAEVSGIRQMGGPRIEVNAVAHAEAQVSLFDDLSLKDAAQHLLGMPRTLKRAIAAGLIDLDEELREALVARHRGLDRLTEWRSPQDR